ncbi:MAG: PhzF family phenazine biosynthesis protein [Pseudoxanthomonas sp.]
MTTYRYLQLDVFAETRGAGNALGVVLDATNLDAEAMQAIAAWLNLPETVFFLPPPEEADYHIRIFTPACELPFAGHPSVGAAWAAVHCNLVTPRDGGLMQSCAAGLLPVDITGTGHGRFVHVRAPQAVAQSGAGQQTLLLAALRDIDTVGRPPALWNNGPGWWLAELRDAAALQAMQPDFPAIAALSLASDATGLAVFALTDNDGLVVRAFCPADAPNTPEDPVTGSANACIAAWLHAQGRLPGVDGRYVARQGMEVGRDGRLHLQVEADGAVWIGGQVQQVIDGTLDW